MYGMHKVGGGVARVCLFSYCKWCQGDRHTYSQGWHSSPLRLNLSILFSRCCLSCKYYSRMRAGAMVRCSCVHARWVQVMEKTNKQMDPAKVQRTMIEFEKQNAQMEMTGEMSMLSCQFSAWRESLLTWERGDDWLPCFGAATLGEAVLSSGLRAGHWVR